jgi:hypothetical protein
VETAGQLLDFVRDAQGFYANLHDTEPRVILAHSRAQLLTDIGADLGGYAAEVLERNGVGVRLNTRKDLSDAWRTAIARVFELSSPELTPLWAVQPPPPGGLAEHVPLIAYIGTPVGAFLLATPLF